MQIVHWSLLGAGWSLTVTESAVCLQNEEEVGQDHECVPKNLLILVI
jgi:hypothetical protein